MGMFGRKVHLTETPDVRHIMNPDVMHEESDVNVRGVGTFVFALFIFFVIVCVLMLGLYKYFSWREARNEAREFHSPIARTAAERLPPAPRLQGAPGSRSLDDPSLVNPESNYELQWPQAEWEQLSQKYDYELHNFGAPDPNTQTVRVPIEDAKQRLLQQGLPVRAQAQPPGELGGMDIPTLSNGGHVGRPGTQPQTEKRDQ